MNDNELLKAKLQVELSEISQKSPFTTKDLELAHIITDTIKNIDKIKMLESGNHPPTDTISLQTIPQNVINYTSDSEFSDMVHGKDSEKVWKVVEELMESLSVLLPKLYNAVCEKFRDI